MNDLYIFIAIYFGLISVVAAVVTIFDKRAAKKQSRRVSEKSLLLIAFFGGAVSMFVTMKSIRHKTKHAKFMVGLPFFILLHIAAVVLLLIYLN